MILPFLAPLTEICPSRTVGWTLQRSLLALWMDENSNQQSNKIADNENLLKSL